MFKKIAYGLSAVTLIAGTLAAVPAAAAEWPSKPITLIVPWGAGGGTDATARMIASLLEEKLGTPVPVENRTGGSGVVGHSAIARAKPDGYTMGVATLEIGGMHYQGLTKIDYTAYEPIGLYNADPAAIFVRTDGPYADAKGLIEAIRKSSDRELKASGSAQGGVNHLATAGMLRALDIDVARVAWVPSEGAAPGLQDLAASGVNFAVASLPEGQALMDAGRIKPVALFAAERNSSYPDLPTFTEAADVPFQMGSWRGLVVPKGTSPEIVARLQEVIGQVVQEKRYLDFMKSMGYATQWTAGEDFRKFMADSDKTLGETLKAVGLAR